MMKPRTKIKMMNKKSKKKTKLEATQLLYFFEFCCFTFAKIIANLLLALNPIKSKIRSVIQ